MTVEKFKAALELYIRHALLDTDRELAREEQWEGQRSFLVGRKRAYEELGRVVETLEKVLAER